MGLTVRETNAPKGGRLDLHESDPVTVTTNAAGPNAVVAFVDIPPCSLSMYYLEANAPVSRRVARTSAMPRFEPVAAGINRSGRGDPGAAAPLRR